MDFRIYLAGRKRAQIKLLTAVLRHPLYDIETINYNALPVYQKAPDTVLFS